MSSAAPLTLGTAGHIDHGKTALIRALTGVDTDRLPEEQARGISITLGYACLTLPSGQRLSIVDVPGHDRFVRTMVAGATGVDLSLMTVAADDGVMPQTREHATVLRALNVTRGVIAVTKRDLADPEIAVAGASDLLPGLEVVAVSARTGQGLNELLEALDRAAAGTPRRADRPGPARLHVDRAFTIRGAGTVVTGTLWSGVLQRGDELRLLPRGRRVRIRATQVHDEPVQRAAAGQRVAVNLTGLAVADIARGDVLASVAADLSATYRIDARLELGESEAADGERVQIHHGTREAPARLVRLGGAFWQVRLEQPLVPARGDRLVVRRIAPPDTLGGGEVLDPHPPKHGASREVLAGLERLARGEVQPGPARDEGPRRPPAVTGAPSELPPSAVGVEQRLRAAGLKPPPDAELDPDGLAALRAAGRAVRVAKNLHYHPEALADARRRVVSLAERHGGSITLAQLRDDLGTSRKFAQALLEHLDAEKVTIRRGDEHVLRRSARTTRQ